MDCKIPSRLFLVIYSTNSKRAEKTLCEKRESVANGKANVDVADTNQ